MRVVLFAFLFFATCRSLSSPTLGTGRDAVFGFSIRIPSGLPGGLASACHAGATGSISGGRFEPWVREIPWRRAWQPTPVFLPGEPHGQRSLGGYSP